LFWENANWTIGQMIIGGVLFELLLVGDHLISDIAIYFLRQQSSYFVGYYYLEREKLVKK
jgi:hypothetical protein